MKQTRPAECRSPRNYEWERGGRVLRLKTLLPKQKSTLAYLQSKGMECLYHVRDRSGGECNTRR